MHDKSESQSKVLLVEFGYSMVTDVRQLDNQPKYCTTGSACSVNTELYKSERKMLWCE